MDTTYSRRSVLRTGAILGGAAALPFGFTGQAFAARDRLTVRVVRDIQNLDPANRVSFIEGNVIRAVCQRLISFKPGTFEWEPDAAKTITQVTPTLIEFELKPGQMFHGGYGELTAEDVKFSFERFRQPGPDGKPHQYAKDWEALDRVEVDLSDPARPAVWAECGATNRIINDALRAHGLELPYNVVMETVRVGGITSMGTHGSGRHTATLGDLVEAFDVIDATGRRRILSEETAGAEVMSAARLCFGLFGVIARVRLRAEPAQPVLLRDERVPLARALDRLEERLAVEESVELLWFPFSSSVWLHGYTRTDRPLPRRPGLAKSASDLAQMFVLNAVHGAAARLLPRAVPWLLRAYSLAMPYGERVARRSEAIHYRKWLEVIRCTCVEVGFKVGDDFSRVRAAFDAAREVIDEFAARGEFPIDININIRFTGQSKALLSAAWGPGLTCYIEALAMGRPAGWEDCSAALLRAWLQLPGALPHWAKEFEHVPGVIPTLRGRLGDRLTRFQNALRDSEIDPHGVFRNDLVQRLCLPEKDPQ